MENPGTLEFLKPRRSLDHLYFDAGEKASSACCAPHPGYLCQGPRLEPGAGIEGRQRSPAAPFFHHRPPIGESPARVRRRAIAMCLILAGWILLLSPSSPIPLRRQPDSRVFEPRGGQQHSSIRSVYQVSVTPSMSKLGTERIVCAGRTVRNVEYTDASLCEDSERLARNCARFVTIDSRSIVTKLDSSRPNGVCP